MTPSPDLTNRRFGLLVALSREDYFKGQGFFWKCRCDCGKVIKRVSKILLSVKGVSSCGCARRKNLTILNQRFGKLLAIYFYGNFPLGGYKQRHWLCLCQCGKKVPIPEQHLIDGRRVSCGCSKPNLTGNVFGHFTVLRQHGTNKKERTWVCRCVCGAERILTTAKLSLGRKSSCGCSRRKTNCKLNEAKVRGIRKFLAMGYIQAKLAKMYRVDPSSISNIKKGKTWKNVI